MYKTKRVTVILLILVTLFSMASCNKKTKKPTASSSGIISESSGLSSEDEYLDSSSSAASSSAVSSSVKSPAASSSSAPQTYQPGAGVADVVDYSKVTVPHYNSGSNKNVSVVTAMDPNSSWMKAWTQAYKGLYGGDVTYTVVDEYSINSRLAAMKAGGKPADCATMSVSTSWPMVIQDDLVQDAGKIIDFSIPLWQTMKSSQKTTLYNGKNYFVVTESFPFYGIVFNKKVFRDSGLADPYTVYKNGNWTWDVFLDYAKKLTIDSNSDGINDIWGVQSDYWEAFLLTCGKDFISINESGYSLNLNDPSILRAVDFLRNLGPAKYNVTTKIAYGDALTMMKQGNLGMLISASPLLNLPDMIETGTVGYAPMPRDPKADKPYTMFNTTGLYILKGASNPTAAADYAATVRIYTTPQLSTRLIPKEYQIQDSLSKAKQDFLKQLNDLYDDERANIAPVQCYFYRFRPTLFPYSLWVPLLYDSKPWSSIVQEKTPLINAEIAKLK